VVVYLKRFKFPLDNFAFLQSSLLVDIVAVLTDNDFQSARKYWNKLSQRLKEEGNQPVTICHQLKLKQKKLHLVLSNISQTSLSGDIKNLD
jgi:hypothetical protein